LEETSTRLWICTNVAPKPSCVHKNMKTYGGIALIASRSWHVSTAAASREKSGKCYTQELHVSHTDLLYLPRTHTSSTSQHIRIRDFNVSHTCTSLTIQACISSITTCTYNIYDVSHIYCICMLFETQYIWFFNHHPITFVLY
jgi:hypothetical protein